MTYKFFSIAFRVYDNPKEQMLRLVLTKGIPQLSRIPEQKVIVRLQTPNYRGYIIGTFYNGKLGKDKTFFHVWAYQKQGTRTWTTR